MVEEEGWQIPRLCTTLLSVVTPQAISETRALGGEHVRHQPSHEARRFFRVLHMICQAYSYCRPEPGIFARVFRHVRTPLGFCALLDNHGLSAFLIRSQADPEIRGDAGLRPIEPDRRTVRAIFRDPSRHVAILENDS